MQSLDEKKWKRIPINSVFVIGHGFYNKKPPMSPEGNVPFIGASGINNGVTGFCTMQAIEVNSKVGYGPNEPIERKLFNKGSICVVNNGSAIGYSYYQPKQFTCTHDVNPLTLRDHEISKDEALFLAQMIRQQGDCFIYARKWRPSRMVSSQFLLPVDSAGNPDYEYMAEYTRQKREAILSRYRVYVEKRIEALGEPVEIPALNEKKWSHFKMPEIFEMIQRGKRLKTADHVSGLIPYVSSTANNNGVDDYIEATPGTRVFGDCISLANSGSVGTAFYEPFDFVASDHVTALKTEGMSKYCYLFMTALIEKQGSNFNFNREINDARIQNMQVMLPVNDPGEPDYEYMEQYSKNMMIKKYKQYLAFMDRKGGQPVE